MYKRQGVITTEAIIPEPLQWNTDNTIALYAKKADSEKTLFYTEDSQVNQATFEAVKKAFPTPQEGDYIRAFYPAGKAKDKANATSTVSYTHLDVYKRQLSTRKTPTTGCG